MTAFEDFVVAELPKRSALDTVVTVSYDNDPNDPSAPDALKNAPIGQWFREDSAAKWWRKIGGGATDWEDQSGGGGGAATQLRTLYVGKHGSDANDGTNIDLAKLTIGSAVTAATALTPTVGAPVVIRILDAGIYDEAVVLPAYVHLDGPRAEVTRSSAGVDTVTANAGCVVRLRRASCGGLNGFAVTTAAAATGAVYFDVGEIIGTGNGQPISNRGGSATLTVRADLGQTNYRGVVETKSAGSVALDIQNMVMGANNTNGLLNGFGAAVTGRVGSVRKLTGGLTGTTGLSGGIETTLVCGEIDADTAINASFGNTMNVVVGRLVGSTTGSGTINLLAANAGAAGDVVGPASSTDNAVARFDLATGKLLQNSGVTLSDTGAMLFPASGSISNPGSDSQTEAFGSGASTTGSRGTAFGNNATAGDSACAFGPSASASGNQSCAFGRDAAASTSNSVALGYNATASGNEAIAVGNSVTASQPQSTAVGRNPTATALGGTALGYQSTASHVGSTALGRYAATTATQRVTCGTIGGSYDVSFQFGLGLGAWGATPPASQPLKVADPTGGATVDAESRTAIQAIIDILEGAGLSSAT